MKLTPLSTPLNLSFKSAIPVRYMAMGKDGKYHRVTDPAAIKTCQIKIVKGLNADPDNYNDGKRIQFAEFLKSKDKDYEDTRKAASIFPNNGMWDGYIITGEDALHLLDTGKSIGRIRAICREKYGSSDTGEAGAAASIYYINALNNVQSRYKYIKNSAGDSMCLKLYFHTEYKKRSGEIKDYTFSNANFLPQRTIYEADRERKIAEKANKRNAIIGNAELKAEERKENSSPPCLLTKS